MISIQVSRFAQDGLGAIYVIVNGRQSNSLPFTVRTGNIYFSTLGGNDDTGDGSWSNPWRTIPKAADSLSPGDIAYIGDGVDQFAETNYGAAVNLGSDGEPGRPKALIVYPGATSNVGNDTLGKAFHVWNENTGGYSVYWVMAKFAYDHRRGRRDRPGWFPRDWQLRHRPEWGWHGWGCWREKWQRHLHSGQ